MDVYKCPKCKGELCLWIIPDADPICARCYYMWIADNVPMMARSEAPLSYMRATSPIK